NTPSCLFVSTNRTTFRLAETAAAALRERGCSAAMYEVDLEGRLLLPRRRVRVQPAVAFFATPSVPAAELRFPGSTADWPAGVAGTELQASQSVSFDPQSSRSDDRSRDQPTSRCEQGRA